MIVNSANESGRSSIGLAIQPRRILLQYFFFLRLLPGELHLVEGAGGYLFLSMDGGAEKEAYYTCGKCRSTLFLRGQVMHEGTSGHSNDGMGVSKVKTDWGQSDGTYKGVGGNCSSVFISEMPDWAEGPEGNNGRLICPTCKARVGSFSWSGAPCSCGKWVTPAFQFQLSRVDPKGIISLPTTAVRDASGKIASTTTPQITPRTAPEAS